jgi:hypothetical protein
MLTSYVVKCPHAGCGWFGSLLPKANREPSRGALSVPAGHVQFECPQCGGSWKAALIGEDVMPLALEEAVVP